MVTKNTKSIIRQVLSSSDTYGLLPVVDIDGVRRYIANLLSFPAYVETDFTLYDDVSGVSVGSGTTAATENDYQLEQTITTGLSGTITNAKIVDVDGNAAIRYSLSVQNTSGSTITISEIGYKQELEVADASGGTTATNRVFLLDRTVFPTITLPAGETAYIDYTLKSVITNNAGVLGTKTITQNGTYNALDDTLDGYSSVTVNIPAPILGTKTITQNGTYTASTESLDGYSQVTVNVSGGGGIDISSLEQVVPVLAADDPSVVEVDSQWSGSWPGWKALDGNETDAWISDTSSSYPAENWIKITLSEPVIPVMFWYKGFDDSDVVPPTSVTVIDYDTDRVLFTLTPTDKYSVFHAWNGTYTGPYVSTIKIILDQPSRASSISRVELYGIPAQP